MDQEIVWKPTSYFRPFPAMADVFDPSQHSYGRFLLPLASVSLQHIDPTLDGSVHFVLPIDHCSGLIGEATPQHHTYYCRENWVGFHVGDDSRYKIDCPVEFFVDVASDPNNCDGIDRYREAIEVYETERKNFTKRNAVFGRYSETPVRHAFLRGHQGWPNFASLKLFPFIEREFINEQGQPDVDYVPTADDGSEFLFVGWLHAFAYCYRVACNVYLFYHPGKRIALETFDYS